MQNQVSKDKIANMQSRLNLNKTMQPWQYIHLPPTPTSNHKQEHTPGHVLSTHIYKSLNSCQSLINHLITRHEKQPNTLEKSTRYAAVEIFIKNIFYISGYFPVLTSWTFCLLTVKTKIIALFLLLWFYSPKILQLFNSELKLQNTSLIKVRMTHFEVLRALSPPVCLWDLPVHKWHQQNSLGKVLFCKTWPLLPLMIFHRARGSQFAQLVALSTGNTGFPNQYI